MPQIKTFGHISNVFRTYFPTHVEAVKNYPGCPRRGQIEFLLAKKYIRKQQMWDLILFVCRIFDTSTRVVKVPDHVVKL